MRSHVLVVGVPTEGSGDLTATPGDHEIDLSWEAVPGASSYTVRRADPAHVTPSLTVIASGVAATTYLDSPTDYAGLTSLAPNWSGKMLTPGMEYTYTVESNNGTTLGPATARPYYVADYPPTSWASNLVNGYAVRDARSCGHWEVISGTPTTYTSNQNYSPGAVVEDVIFDGCQPRLLTAGSYTFRRCWLQEGLYNEAGESSLSTILLEDCTVGPQKGLGAASGAYDINGSMGGNGGKITARRCMFHMCRVSLFTHAGSPNLIEDNYFTRLYSYEGGDPGLIHNDYIWSQFDGGSATTIRRNYFEGAGYQQSSHILNDNAPNESDIVDNLFNGMSANGCVSRVSGGTLTGNRWMRYPTGGFNETPDNGIPIKTVSTPASESDNKWADTNVAV
jgi:hypothetical protein